MFACHTGFTAGKKYFCISLKNDKCTATFVPTLRLSLTDCLWRFCCISKFRKNSLPVPWPQHHLLHKLHCRSTHHDTFSFLKQQLRTHQRAELLACAITWVLHHLAEKPVCPLKESKSFVCTAPSNLRRFLPSRGTKIITLSIRIKPAVLSMRSRAKSTSSDANRHCAVSVRPCALERDPSG